MPAPIVIAGLAAARVVAGIVGRGARNVAPVYRNMNTGSVKVIPDGGQGVTGPGRIISSTTQGRGTQQQTNNRANTQVQARKSGELAKTKAAELKDNGAYQQAQRRMGTPTKKINSGNTRAR